MDLYSSQETLDLISRHCPESLSAYLQCMNRCDDEGTFFFSRKIVENNLSENWQRFKNHIKKLARENLLEWHEFDGGISVTLASFGEE
jgi:hypothetical protein